MVIALLLGELPFVVVYVFFSMSELASDLEYERKIKIEWFAESNKEF